MGPDFDCPDSGSPDFDRPDFNMAPDGFVCNMLMASYRYGFGALSY